MARAGAAITARRWRGDNYTAALAGLLLAAIATGTAWAQPSSVRVSRNLFFDRSDRPSATLRGGTGLSLGPQRVDAGAPAKLRLTSPTALVSAAFNFRPDPEAADRWILTIFITTQAKDRDFYYLNQGQRIADGKLIDQANYYANGLETELSGPDATGQARTVREIVLQDDGQSELRLALDGDTLQIAVVPPKFGGSPNPGRFPWGQGPPLRFLDYQFLGGGYLDNAFGEIWAYDFIVLRANYFTNDTETRGLARAALAYQVWRSERFSTWFEAGGFISQQRDEKDNVTHDVKYGLALGVTGHWRYKAWGAAVHLGSAGGPLVAQLLGGWQLSERWGAVLSWQHMKDSSAFGLGASVNW